MLGDQEGSESSPLLRSPEVLSDKHRLAYIIFVIQGLGILLPWNAFISAADYFTDLYGSSFVFFISLVFNWSGALCYLFLSKVLPRFTFTSRVYTSLAFFTVILILIPLIEPTPREVSLIITLIGVCFTGLAAAVMQSSIAGMAALFPPEYMGGMMSGCGIAGIVAIALRVITKASMPLTRAGKEKSGRIFFMLAAGVAVLCAITFAVLWRLPVTKYHLSKQLMQKKEDNPSFSVIIRKVWKEALVVVVTLFTTLSLFPGITGLLTSNNGINADWFPILITALFMLFDFVGRTLPQFIHIFRPAVLPIPALSRFIFFPLLILCIHPHVIRNDVLSCIIISLIALSNGYCSTLAMIYGPQQVSSSEKEFTGIVLSGCLTAGIILGSHFALLLLYLVTGSVGI